MFAPRPTEDPALKFVGDIEADADPLSEREIQEWAASHKLRQNTHLRQLESADARCAALFALLTEGGQEGDTPDKLTRVVRGWSVPAKPGLLTTPVTALRAKSTQSPQ